MGMELGERNETHSEGDEVLLNVEDKGDDAAWGMGRMGEIASPVPTVGHSK